VRLNFISQPQALEALAGLVAPSSLLSHALRGTTAGKGGSEGGDAVANAQLATRAAATDTTNSRGKLEYSRQPGT